MSQLFFDQLKSMMNRGLFRKSDPDTSVEAALSIDTTEIEGYVLEAIKQRPEGCIADDVIKELSGLSSNTITPRFATLIRKGLIIDTGERRRAVSGRNQRVVIAV